MFDDQPRQNLFVWVAAALLVAAVGYRLLSDRPPPAAPAVEVSQPRQAGGKGGGRRLYVHVAGAVKRPGLYRVPQGARVATAIELARGTRRRADLTTVNLAAKVEDGQQIVVPARPAKRAPIAAAGPATDAAAQISLATATQQQLEELPGIGPVLAQSILEYRDTNGGFRSIEELLEVDGIGDQRLEDLRQAVRP